MSSYEYNGITIYEDGIWYIYTQPQGLGRRDFATDVEAEEWIDSHYFELNNDNTDEITPQLRSLYDRFVLYCQKLPGKCFIEGKLATYNENALIRFTKPFEKSNDCKIKISNRISGGETFYIVDEII